MSRYTQGGPDYNPEMHVVSDHTRKTPRLWPWIVLALVLVLCAVGAIFGIAGSLTSVSKEIGTPAPSILPAPERSPEGRIFEGVWSVGEDIIPGKYEVREELGEGTPCYWEISRDSAGQDIVANANPTGGIPRVDLKKGQWFKTQGCGDWEKVNSGDGGRVHTTYVTENLPSSWPVSSAVSFVDRYTGTDWVIVKKCPKDAWRCITVKTGAVKGGKYGAIGRTEWNSVRATIVIDVKDASRSGQFGPKTKRWLLVHELGHSAYLYHRTACKTAMYEFRRCSGGSVPPVKFDAKQKKILTRW